MSPIAEDKNYNLLTTEKEGFEPSNKLPRYSISNAAPSTTRPLLPAIHDG